MRSARQASLITSSHMIPTGVAFKGKLQNRLNCPILSFLEVSPEREQLLQQIQTKLDHLAGGGILAESEFAAPTITKLIPIPFSTSGASVAYNVNPVADQFQRAFQTSTFCNRLYSFFNKRWFFDQVLNDFLVRSFLRFGYEVSFEALDKGAIEILGPYGISYTFRRLAERISQLQSGFVVRRVRYDPWPPAWWGRLLRCG
ncbi:hypothetical protein DCAR_0100155 [Daucus carota subsp. sativus]|uniref:NADH dehydrogenase subunit 5 C-terminal domain-containing protein n=1 Tax=Daucus carota subsp. sativus TaxID=79200 RepID=A0AAF0W3M7_DAUCS|nr:hypothetical protein DCAR_0100155 [Daucus carota subsp. sativus]